MVKSTSEIHRWVRQRGNKYHNFWVSFASHQKFLCVTYVSPPKKSLWSTCASPKIHQKPIPLGGFESGLVGWGLRVPLSRGMGCAVGQIFTQLKVWARGKSARPPEGKQNKYMVQTPSHTPAPGCQKNLWMGLRSAPSNHDFNRPIQFFPVMFLIV